MRPCAARLYRGYGWPDAAPDEALSRRLMAMALLHQFADLPLYIRTAGEPAPRDLAALQRRVVGMMAHAHG